MSTAVRHMAQLSPLLLECEKTNEKTIVVSTRGGATGLWRINNTTTHMHPPSTRPAGAPGAMIAFRGHNGRQQGQPLMRAAQESEETTLHRVAR